MTPSLVYQQSKDTIMQSLPRASKLLMSLIELFGHIDEHYAVLCSELNIMDTNPELKIAAALLKDTHLLVEELLANYAMHITSIIINDTTQPELTQSTIEQIIAAKEVAPEIDNVIYELSAQLADFNELFVGFKYTSIVDFNVNTINQRREVSYKVSKISQLVHQKIADKHKELNDIIHTTSDAYTQSSFIFEAADSVKGKFFVSIIPEVSLIEVGKTEQEVKQKTTDYFDGDDTEYEILPCSQEVYNAFTIHGEVPEEWEVVDGVIVLPDEYEMFNSVDTSRIDESPAGMVKVARLRIRHEVEEVLNTQLDASHFSIKSGYEDDFHYSIAIVPDLFITKEPFSEKDKRVVEVIRSRLNDHEWFERVDVDETDNGTMVLTMEFGDIDIRNNTMNLRECANARYIPSVMFEKTELQERNADATFRAMMVWMVHELEDILKDNLEERHFKVGRYRNMTNIVLDVQPDKIFGDGQLSEKDASFIEKLGSRIEQHPWVVSCEVELPDTGEALFQIKVHEWTEIDLTTGFKLH